MDHKFGIVKVSAEMKLFKEKLWSIIYFIKENT